MFRLLFRGLDLYVWLVKILVGFKLLMICCFAQEDLRTFGPMEVGMEDLPFQTFINVNFGIRDKITTWSVTRWELRGVNIEALFKVG